MSLIHSFNIRAKIIVAITSRQVFAICLKENLFVPVLVSQAFSCKYQQDDHVRSKRGQRLRDSPRGRREKGGYNIFVYTVVRDRVDGKSLGSSRPEKKKEKKISRGRHFKSPLCLVSILHAQRTYTRTHTHTYATRTARSPANKS